MDSVWQEIIGHDWAVEVLSGAIKHDRVGHAYLITGSAQVGKTTLARLFAMALNCTSADARPCGVCRSCRLIQAGRHPDMQIVEPDVNARGKQTLKIDAMRELQRQLQLATYEGRYKIALIRQFDAATVGAANAFLKTLEEPPKNVILILTATEADALLDTIKSRCRVFAIRPIPTPIIKQALITRWHVAPEQAHLLAHIANGRLGWAVQAHQDKTLLTTRSEQLGVLNEVLNGGRIGRFKRAETLAKKPETLTVLLQTWLGWWRDLLLTVHGQGANGAITNIDQRDIFATLAQQWDKAAVLQSLKQTKTALWQLSRNGNTRLVLENLFLIYPTNVGE